jgi:uncharacterized protein YuzE
MATNMKDKNNKKIINYDAQSDVLYLGIKKGDEEEYVEIAPGISVELDENKSVIGVEILHASQVFKPVAKPLEEKALAMAP